MKILLAALLLIPCLALAQSAQPFTPTAGAHCKDESTSSASASVPLPGGAGQYQVYLAPSVATYVQFSRLGGTAVVGQGVQLLAGSIIAGP